ncbi:hypothetical protein COOONC_00925 [Cooperia oncophora]
MPDWVTDQFYSNVQDLTERTADYVFGNGDFGEDDDTEIIMLRGGSLLKEILDNFQLVTNAAYVKYHAYSAHDQTVAALLRTLGAKLKLIGHDNPQYAAVVVFEFWQGPSGYYIKVRIQVDQTMQQHAIANVNNWSTFNSSSFSKHRKIRIFITGYGHVLCK